MAVIVEPLPETVLNSYSHLALEYYLAYMSGKAQIWDWNRRFQSLQQDQATLSYRNYRQLHIFTIFEVESELGKPLEI